jgi:hypothetical protein
MPNKNKIIQWFLKEYLPRYKLKIVIRHKNLEDNYGELYIEDSYKKPRSFKILIHKDITNLLYIETLLHELWHIYQFVKGEVKIENNRTYHHNIEVDPLLEEECLFEKEAELMEDVLKKNFLHTINL